MQLDLILIALVIALEPIPLLGYFLVLSSAGGIRKGLAFVLGWFLTLLGIVVVTLLLTGGKPLKTDSSPAKAALAVRILIGAVLLWYAWRLQRRPPKPPSPPSWVSRVDRLKFGGAMALGFLLQPWPLVAAGAASISAWDLSQGATWAWLAAFVLLSTSTYLVVQVRVMLSPTTSEERLHRWSTWITDNRRQILILVSYGLGLWLIVHSAWLLA